MEQPRVFVHVAQLFHCANATEENLEHEQEVVVKAPSFTLRPVANPASYLPVFKKTTEKSNMYLRLHAFSNLTFVAAADSADQRSDRAECIDHAVRASTLN